LEHASNQDILVLMELLARSPVSSSVRMPSS
jgi:hypothetical protein